MAILDVHLDGWPLRNDDFSGGTKKLPGALNFEFTEIFYEMKMKKMFQCFLGGSLIN